jgi:hypothetical protein
MKKSTDYKKQFVFVCYQPGSGGEKLSTWIAQAADFEPLTFYKTPQDRTVITNEYFEKIFLNPVGPFENLLQTANKILETKPTSSKLNVVPSHWDYDLLHPHFAHSKFIRIVHNDPETICEIVTEKVFGGKLQSLLELKGYCMMYIDEPEFLNLFLKRKISMSMTIGEIHDIILPYITKTVNSKKKYKNYTIKLDNPNILNVWYNDFDQQQILDFVRS